MKERMAFRVFVAGCSARSVFVLRQLHARCSAEAGEKYDVEVIDVLEHPALAESEKILVTPTVIKILPGPIKRMLGDFSDVQGARQRLQSSPRVSF